MDERFQRLSARERQVMDVLFRLGEGPASDVADQMPTGVSLDTVRVTLANLEKKQHVRHRRVGRHFVFAPRRRQKTAKLNALRHLVRTFFGGSPSQAILEMIDLEGRRLSEEELARISDRLRSLEEGRSEKEQS